VLDAKTGDYKYHFKLVPKDWHDWDVSNPPVLIQTMGGKLGQGSPISRKFAGVARYAGEKTPLAGLRHAK
jgi:hypothetical protein